MSQKKGLNEFVEILKTDQKLANKLESVGTDVEKVISLGKENGYDFGVEDLQKLHESTSQATVEFSDEDLEKVAGGVVTLVVAACAAVVAAGVMVANAMAGSSERSFDDGGR